MKVHVTISHSTPNPSPKYKGWRVLHKAEGGWPSTPAGMPEVMPPENSISLSMNKTIQEMSYQLMTRFNSLITPQLWTRVHDHDRAFTNFNGFNKDGDPRANFILNENITSPLPKYDKAQRVCGGSFIHGQADNGYLYCQAGRDGIDADGIMPSLDVIISNNWYIYAVSIGMDETQISHFPQGKGGPVVIPFIFRGIIKFPLQYFENWEGEDLPDPLH